MRLSWGCDSFKAKNIFILSQTEPWEILVRVAIPTRTACARGYSHAHKTLILVYISVRVAKSRARILYTNMHPGISPMLASQGLFLFTLNIQFELKVVSGQPCRALKWNDSS